MARLAASHCRRELKLLRFRVVTTRIMKARSFSSVGAAQAGVFFDKDRFADAQGARQALCRVLSFLLQRSLAGLAAKGATAGRWPSSTRTAIAGLDSQQPMLLNFGVGAAKVQVRGWASELYSLAGIDRPTASLRFLGGEGGLKPTLSMGIGKSRPFPSCTSTAVPLGL